MDPNMNGPEIGNPRLRPAAAAKTTKPRLPYTRPTVLKADPILRSTSAAPRSWAPGPQMRSVQESQFKYDPNTAAEDWCAVYDMLAAQDAKMLKAYQEETDFLLIFAGLFSAVVTGFIGETYHNLQEDFTQTTAAILLQISQQLSTSAVSVVNQPIFEPAPSDVRVNVYWFISLVLSLASAIFGIFIKQWIRSYMTWVDISPAQTAVTVRQFRYEGMLKWRLREVTMVLPVLLQSSLVLFSVGLMEFCVQLNFTLGVILCTVIGFCLLAVIGATFMPIFSSTSPYRSPWSALLAMIRLKIVAWVFGLRDRMRIRSFRDEYLQRVIGNWISGPPTWDQMDQASMNIKSVMDDETSTPSWEARSLSYLLSTNRHEGALHVALRCLFRNEPSFSENGVWQLHITDCWQVVKRVLGHNTATTPDPQRDSRLHFHASSLSPVMRQALFSFLIQGISTWIESPTRKEANSVMYAKQSFAMLECLWSFCSTEKDVTPLIIDYLGLLMRLREIETWPVDENVRSTLFMSYAGHPRAPLEFLERWSSQEITSNARFRVLPTLAATCHDTSLGVDGTHISITAVLQAVHQYSGACSSTDIASYLNALDCMISLRWDGTMTQYHPISFDPWFWQAMYVIGSCRAQHFPPRLVRRLCAASLDLAEHPPASEPGQRMFDDLAQMPLEDTWSLLLMNCRQLGAQQREWMCPGFEPE